MGVTSLTQKTTLNQYIRIDRTIVYTDTLISLHKNKAYSPIVKTALPIIYCDVYQLVIEEIEIFREIFLN